MNERQILRIIAYHNRMREKLIFDNERFLDESVKYKTEIYTYERNPSESVERKPKEALALRVYDYYRELLAVNNRLLDDIEPEMQEWIDRMAPDMPIDVFVQLYATQLEQS